MIHIAIMKQPFLKMILDGEKTIESRWSIHKIVPYHAVSVGDIVLFKETGKDISVSAVVIDVKFFELTSEVSEKIKEQYGCQIGIYKFKDWDKYSNKKYCTLIFLGNIKKVSPMRVKRSNGAGWFVLKD